jgi:hypothetical protein
MKNRFSPQFSDEDLDLYLLGKASQNLTASIEEHYFGASVTGYPSDVRRWEVVVIALTVASLLPLASSSMNQKRQVEAIASAVTTPALPFASAIAASIDLFAPTVLPVTTPAVRRLPQADPKAQKQFQLPRQKARSTVQIATVDSPAVVFHSKAIPELPFESEIPQVSKPPKPHRLRRFFSGAAAPFRLILWLDRYNRGA